MKRVCTIFHLRNKETWLLKLQIVYSNKTI